MEQTNQKRQVACKVKVQDISKGEYFKEEGWEPNYIKIGNKKISRVNVFGIVVSSDIQENVKSIVIDDGSGEISVRIFEGGDILNNINIGDAVVVIGRPREYGSERYLLGEIVKKLDNVEWMKVRKLEVGDSKIPVVEKKTEEPIEKESVEEQVEVEETPSEKIMDAIRKLDSGAGADFDEIIKQVDNGEKIVETLMMEGEVFEVSPGKLKVLE